MAKLGYTFYPKDWQTNDRVFALNLEERAVYRELIDLAMINDNQINFDLKIWSRKLGAPVEKLEEIIKVLSDTNLVAIKTNNQLFIPSCEKRLVFVRSGKKGGKSKPSAKGNDKPISKPSAKGNANQREIEREREREYNKDSFEKFWDLYGKKRSKDKAFKLWIKLSTADQEEIIDYVPSYVKSTPDQKFRKDPSTFLYNKAWKDELIQINSIKPILSTSDSIASE